MLLLNFFYKLFILVLKFLQGLFSVTPVWQIEKLEIQLIAFLQEEYTYRRRGMKFPDLYMLLIKVQKC